MGNSSIEWTDATWNPTRGCTKISPGCKNCYAETFAERWRGIVGHTPSEVKIMTDRDTGRSRGFGFVTLPDDADLKRAIEDTNGREFQGRQLNVSEAKPMERSSGAYREKREPRW